MRLLRASVPASTAAVALGLGLTGVAVAPAATTDPGPLYLTNNVQSAEYSAGLCKYRVQLGQFGSSAYAQLKLRGECSPYENPHIRVDYARGSTRSSVTVVPRYTDSTTQATAPDAIVTGGHFRICGRTKTTGRPIFVCASRTLKLR